AEAFALDVYLGDLAARRAGLQLRHVRVSQQRHVLMLERGIDTDHLRVRLGIDEARIAVAGVAADASALVRVLLVAHQAKRSVKGMQSLRSKVVTQLLHPRLV